MAAEGPERNVVNPLLQLDNLVSYQDLIDFQLRAEMPRQTMLDAMKVVLEDSGFTVTFERGTRRAGVIRRVIVAVDTDGTVYRNGVNTADRDDEILFVAGDVFIALVPREE